MSTILFVVIVSEVFALFLILGLWRSADLLFIRIALSIVALIPVLGPVLVLWIANFPDPAPVALRNEYRGKGRGRYYARWGPIVNATNPIRRFRLWRAEIARGRTDD